MDGTTTQKKLFCSVLFIEAPLQGHQGAAVHPLGKPGKLNLVEPKKG
jgi:hypothetical protein